VVVAAYVMNNIELRQPTVNTVKNNPATASAVPTPGMPPML